MSEKKITEETRTTCPRCKSASIGPGETECKDCASKKPGSKPPMPGRLKNETSSGGVGGFQVPMGVKERRSKLDRVMELHEEIGLAGMVMFLKGLTEERAARICEMLDQDKLDEVAHEVKLEAARLAVRARIQEVVRKKKGGGGYVLYAPNKGKKHSAKPVATFPTKLAAKRAELARFPPKDPKKLGRLRKEVDKLMKDPKKRAEAERSAHQDKEHPHNFGESVALASKELLERKIIAEVVKRDVRRHVEGLFREENSGSEWDDAIKKLSGKALSNDKGFQKYQSMIAKGTHEMITQSFRKIAKSCRDAGAKVKPSGIQKHDDGRSYLPITVETENGSVGPIYVYVEKGRPRVEVSDRAKADMTKMPPELAKNLRAQFAMVSEDGSDENPLAGAVAKRDGYLRKTEMQIDKMVSNLTPLQLSMMKNLLVKKYRKIS